MAVFNIFSSLRGSAYNGMLGQYGINNTVSVAGVWIDYIGPAVPVGDAQIVAEIDRVKAISGQPNTANSQWVVLTQSGTAIVGGALFCGRRKWGQSFQGFGLYIYDLIPYQGDSARCLRFEGRGVIRDAETTITSHEYAEAVTDPVGGNWWTGPPDPAGRYEIGDLCEYRGGVIVPGVTGRVQRLWSNTAAICTTQ